MTRSTIMSEKIHTIPSDFFEGNISDTSLYFYETSANSINNKIIFEQHTICFLVKGTKTVYSKADHHTFDGSTLMLLHAGNTLMTEKTTHNNEYKSILAFFSDKFLSDFIIQNHIKPPEAKTHHTLILLAKDAYIQHFETSLALLKNEPFLSNALVETKITEILHYLLTHFPDRLLMFFQNALSRNQHNPFLEVINGVKDYNLTNAELAFLCNMSVSTFKRRFSEVFNTSPSQYFRAQKMNNALMLIREGKRPSEIYEALGYENLSTFSQEFKKFFGVSPRASIQEI